MFVHKNITQSTAHSVVLNEAIRIFEWIGRYQRKELLKKNVDEQQIGERTEKKQNKKNDGLGKMKY